MCAQIAPIDIPKSYRLLNVGGTTLISAKHNGKVDVMAATWACPLDFNAVSVVIGGNRYTRKLINESGYFAVQLPTVGILDQVMKVGTISKNDDEDKLAHSGVELFYQDGYDIPLVKGCNGWLICKVIPEPHNEETYGLIFGEIIAGWSDERVFKNGHWDFEHADESLSTVHYVAGCHFYAIGRHHVIKGVPDEL